MKMRSKRIAARCNEKVVEDKTDDHAPVVLL